MIQNVYGMIKYDNLTTNRPYISSSNYIIKMSNIKKDGIWNIDFDSLFRKFIAKNKKIFKRTIYNSMYL